MMFVALFRTWVMLRANRRVTEGVIHFEVDIYFRRGRLMMQHQPTLGTIWYSCYFENFAVTVFEFCAVIDLFFRTTEASHTSKTNSPRDRFRASKEPKQPKIKHQQTNFCSSI